MLKKIPVAVPVLNGNESKYVMDCIESTWISSNGSYIGRFEQQFADFCGVKHAVSCTSGTTALHLALLAHGVQAGDEIIMPTFSFIATANAVAYCGATPVFADSDPDTWNVDPASIVSKITDKTKGIIAVHLYGHPADMDRINEMAEHYGLFVLEDAAEAIGAEYKGKRTGSLGDSAVFSTFGNKIITTGEGGVFTTNQDELAAKARLLRGQGMDPDHRYWHPIIGYNYRMTNIQAAIGCAQMEKAEWHIAERIRVAGLYGEALQSLEGISLPVQKEWAKHVYWMYSVVLEGATEQQRDLVMRQLLELGIETRPFFYPMHTMPPYRHLQPDEDFPVSMKLCASGINLPSHALLTKEDIQWIADCLAKVLSRC
ncbi:DegT/DnrJ/EryC1/StrS family aminotransferase [Paenibacillus protaetiae]|uniref:DegT/DnrJ/EryC1/StrS family aminotransferase n=1 Tax=Paenibacillus protaetiae TaxID=2509456 RepID=UPI002448F068|nr:DegT/DnrJ/EryC1/StrS family aminotransferase [Paenibacillus protaetiae]